MLTLKESTTTKSYKPDWRDPDCLVLLNGIYVKPEVMNRISIERSNKLPASMQWREDPLYYPITAPEYAAHKKRAGSRRWHRQSRRRTTDLSYVATV